MHYQNEEWMMSDIEIIDMFKSKGIKATPQRVVVYKALMELKHPCAEEVIEQVRSKTPLVSVATVYNVLEFFFKSGLINKVLTGDNRMYFDVDVHEHHHLYCSNKHDIA